MKKYTAGLLLVYLLIPVTAGIAGSNNRQVRLAITSDLHGWLSTALVYPNQRRKGLLHLKGSIERLRSIDPDLILLDSGDLLQGAPLVSFIHKRRSRPAEEDPFFQMVLSLEYDAIAVGNHDLAINPLFERNYVPRSNFSWLAANLHRQNRQVFQPYVILHRFGLKIAVLGFSTPGSRMWLGADQLNGLQCESIASSATRWLTYLQKKERPDLIFGLFHSGISAFRDDENSKLSRIAAANAVTRTLKQNSGFHLVIAGHDHRLSPYSNRSSVRYIAGTPVIEGGKWGEALIDLSLTVNQTGDEWKITGINSRIHRATRDSILEQGYKHQLPVDYLEYLYEPLPWRLTTVDNQSAMACLNLLIAISQDTPGLAGTILPQARMYGLSKRIGKQIRRLELYKWLRHDNRTITVKLSKRDIYLLQNPEPEYGRRRVPGNRRVHTHLKTGWKSKTTGVVNGKGRIYPIKISDYHFNGGGGIIPQLFLPLDSVLDRSVKDLREGLFEYLLAESQLPETCHFLKIMGPEITVNRVKEGR